MAARIVRLTPPFLRATQRLGIHSGTKVGRALAAVIRALATAPALPAPGDVAVILPPVVHLHARHVPNPGVWVLYRLGRDGALVLVQLVRFLP